MANRRKKTRVERVKIFWKELPNVARGLIIALGLFAGGIVSIHTAWGIGERVIESKRFWAGRDIETVVAGLQIDSLRSKEAQNRYQIFSLEDEKRRDGPRFPRWKEDLLNRIKFEQQQLEREIKRLEGR